MNTISAEGKNEIIQKAIDSLEYNDGGIFASDLHHEIYNTDYFIIGRYQAEEWLTENYGVFNAMGTIREYEMLNFGEVTTDLSEPERVCNMLVYIIGEEILNESDTLQDKWDEVLTEEDCEAIAEELKEL